MIERASRTKTCGLKDGKKLARDTRRYNNNKEPRQVQSTEVNAQVHGVCTCTRDSGITVGAAALEGLNRLRGGVFYAA